MGGNENSDAPVAGQIDQQFPESIAGYRVYARSRLVQNQHFWFVDHRHRQRQALPNTERHIVGQLIHDRIQIKAISQFLQPGWDVRRRQMEQLGVQQQIPPHRQLAVQRKRLRHIANPLADGEVAGVHDLTEQPRFTG